MEFVVCYCDRKVGFCFFARGETGEKLCVQEGDPDCLGWGAPVEEGEEGSC